MIVSRCLLDTGPLLAMLDKTEEKHGQIKKLLSNIETPLITCESVLSEACFLIRKFNPQGPEEIFSLGKRDFYRIGINLQNELGQVETILTKYQDQPISLADACLIRCAELFEEPRILTFDTDFQFYRWGRNRKFQILN